MALGSGISKGAAITAGLGLSAGTSLKGATAKVTLGGARQCQAQPWSAQRAFPGPLWGPGHRQAQAHLLAPCVPGGRVIYWFQPRPLVSPPSASRLQNRERKPGNVPVSRFPHRESARALLKPLIPRPGLTAGWLPSSSVSGWQSMNQLSRGLTPRAQPRPQRLAHLCQAAPPSRLQTPSPGQGPPARRPSSRRPYSRKTQSCLQNKSMLMSGCRTGLHICSAEVPLQTSPASPPAPQPPTLGVGGWGKGLNSV